MELADRGYKITLINVLKYTLEDVNDIHKQMRNFIRNESHKKMMEILRLK